MVKHLLKKEINLNNHLSVFLITLFGFVLGVLVTLIGVSYKLAEINVKLKLF